jgi:hypothetical protein
MLRPIWEGCASIVSHMGVGEVLMASHLWRLLLSDELLTVCDPFFAFVRLLLSLPRHLRHAPHLYATIARRCHPQYDLNTFRLRVISVCEAIGGSQNVFLGPLPENITCNSNSTTLLTFSHRQMLSISRFLPRVLQDKQWFTNAVERRCGRCQRVPAGVALCLVCGAFACRNEDCCRGADSVGECSQHTKLAHGGTGLWLDVKQSSVLILRPGGGCIGKSIYLDSYGEEDVGLVRGRPLTLCNEIVEEMRRRLICGALVDLTINTGKRLLLSSWENF